jgi:hypothetical protein
MGVPGANSPGPSGATVRARGGIPCVRVAAPRPERSAGKLASCQEDFPYSSSPSSAERSSEPPGSSRKEHVFTPTQRALISPDSARKLSDDCDPSVKGDILSIKRGFLMTNKQKCLRAASEQVEEGENEEHGLGTTHNKERQGVLQRDQNLEKGGERNEGLEEDEENSVCMEKRKDVAKQVESGNTQPDEEEHGGRIWQNQSREAGNVSFCPPRLSSLTTPAMELPKMPHVPQRNETLTHCHVSGEDQQHDETSLTPNEQLLDRRVLVTARSFELRSSETLGRLVAERRDRLGMRNDPLRFIRRRMINESRYCRGRGGGVSDMRGRRRRQRGAGTYVRYSYDSSSENEGQEMGDEYDP